MKKINLFNLTLVVLCLIFALPLFISNNYTIANADSGAEIVESGVLDNSDISWTLDSEGLLTITGTGVIPDYFYEKATIFPPIITNIVVENGITGIGLSAFDQFFAVETVVLPESLTSISSAAFSGCQSLESINLPSSLEFLGANVFVGCSNLKTLRVPENVTNLDEYALVHTHFETLYAPCGFDITEFYRSTSTTSGAGGDIKYTTTDINIEYYNHIYNEWEVTKEATTLSAGEKTRTCICGNKVETESIPMLEKPVNILGIISIVLGSVVLLGIVVYVIVRFVIKKRARNI